MERPLFVVVVAACVVAFTVSIELLCLGLTQEVVPNEEIF